MIKLKSAGEIDRMRPSRVVIDSLSEVRLLAQDPLRYRRHILTLRQFLDEREITALLLDFVGHNDDRQLESLCHGIIQLDQLAPAAELYLDVATLGSELRGVREQVPHHLLQAVRVAHQRWKIWVQLRGERHTFAVEGWACAVDSSLDDAAKIHARGFDPQLAVHDARDVEQVLD